MGSILDPTPLLPWLETQCIFSAPLSLVAGCKIFLKLDCDQPSGSFKSRGIGNLMLKALERHEYAPGAHFYCSSGGNAGLACITAAITLNKPATIVVPLTTTPFMIAKLQSAGAEVYQVGQTWSDADTYLREELLAKDQNGVYVPPFDHPDIWYGASTIVDELEKQVGHYDGIVCSVGGGGLLCGIMQGLEKHGHSSTVKVLAVETDGADSLAQSLQRGEHITLPGITSIATSLGCVRVAKQTYKEGQKSNVTSMVFSDAEAAMASVLFNEGHGILVEAACGVSIAAIYNGSVKKVFGEGMSEVDWSNQKVIIEVCGGSNITYDLLEEYQVTYNKLVAWANKS